MWFKSLLKNSDADLRMDELIALVTLVKFHHRVINKVVWNYMHAIVMKFIATCTHSNQRSPGNNLLCVKRYQL